tara:strand:+ start:472 stop:1497 length:1026 start_codon:yes stop_codon:yes gene_type:complete
MADYTSIDNPELYFQNKLYTGNGTAIGSGGQAITLDGDVDMAPNFVWIKNRVDAHGHQLYDSVRGVTKRLSSNNTGATSTDSEGLTAFGTNGFTLGNDEAVNKNTETYVAWCWKESADAGFDIVSYTGDGSASTTISHSLSAVPDWILVKNRSEATSWCVAHKSLSTDKVLRTDTNGAEGDIGDGELDSPPASSSNFAFNNGSTGTPLKVVNESSDNYIAYLWTAKQGYSHFGTYLGNSSTDGPFVYLGFRPSLIIAKIKSDTNDWFMFDSKRSTFNPVDDSVYPNTAAAENTNHIIDFLSNGFKLRDSDGTVNSTGNTYVYMAFAEAPFVNSNGVPCNAR